MKKKIIVSMLAIAIMVSGVSASMVAEAKCTSWTVYDKSADKCDSTDGCGVFWLKDTKYYYSYQERYCDKKNKQVRETRTVKVKSGCCSK